MKAALIKTPWTRKILQLAGITHVYGALVLRTASSATGRIKDGMNKKLDGLKAQYPQHYSLVQGAMVYAIVWVIVHSPDIVRFCMARYSEWTD